MLEEAVPAAGAESARRGNGGWLGNRAVATAGPAPQPVSLASVDLDAEERTSTGLDEFDRVLGGGLV